MSFEDDKKDAVGTGVVAPVVDGDFVERKNRWQVEQTFSTFAPNSNWSNKDLDPIPPQDRTWHTRDYSFYWISDACCLASWETGSSMVAAGLDWKLCLVAVAMGQLLINFVVTGNGTIGARLNIPFAIIARSSFGFYFAYFAIVSRCIVGFFWLGITAVSGGQCVQVLLNAIWPSFRNVPNHIPESFGVSTAGMVSYLIYFLLQFPLLLVSWTRIQHVFTFKAAVGLVVFLAVFGNTVMRAGGVAPAALTAGKTISGSAKAWLFFNSMNSIMGSYATFSANVPDFARYSKHGNTQWIQTIISPVAYLFVAALGILTASASQSIYGTVVWNPTVILDSWSGSHGARAGAAFCAIALIFVQVGINISANSMASGNDFMAMCPKYINMKRGQVLSSFLGCWVLCPWIILSKAESFLAFMSGYTIVLGPIASLIFFDYWVVKKQKLNVPELYSPYGIYKFDNKFGTNWRALVALLVAVAPGLPGFINNIQPKIVVNANLTHFSDLGYLYSFALCGAIYVGLNAAFPDHNTLMAKTVTRHEAETDSTEA